MRLCFLLLSVPVASGAQGEERVLDLETFRDRLQGGWAGQMIGVSYGEPYEFRAQGQPITEPLREWKPDYLAGSLQQDDLYVEMTFLRALEEHGLHITPEQAGIAFRDSRYPLWHANDAARFNLKQGIMPPQSGHDTILTPMTLTSRSSLTFSASLPQACLERRLVCATCLAPS